MSHLSAVTYINKDHAVLLVVHMFIYNWNEPYLSLLTRHRTVENGGVLV